MQRNVFFFVERVVFFAGNACGFVSLFALAINWADLMKIWDNTTIKLPKFKGKKQKFNFVLEIRILVFSVLFLATGKYLMF